MRKIRWVLIEFTESGAPCQAVSSIFIVCTRGDEKNQKASPKTSRMKVSHVAAMKLEIEHKIECYDAIN